MNKENTISDKLSLKKILVICALVEALLIIAFLIYKFVYRPVA